MAIVATIAKLSWRPAKSPTAEQVQMKVKDTLARILADIPDQAEASLGDPLVVRHRIRRAHHRRQHRPIGGVRRVDTRNMAARNDQHMRRSLRIEIAECHHVGVAIDLCAWNAAVYDAAKETVRISHLTRFTCRTRCSHRGNSSIPSRKPLEARRAQKFAWCRAETFAQEVSPQRGKEHERSGGAATLDARQHARLAPERKAPLAHDAEQSPER